MRTPEACSHKRKRRSSRKYPEPWLFRRGLTAVRSCEKESAVMELGELLYNKSEYIETVRVSRRLPSRF